MNGDVRPISGEEGGEIEASEALLASLSEPISTCRAETEIKFEWSKTGVEQTADEFENLISPLDPPWVNLEAGQ